MGNTCQKLCSLKQYLQGNQAWNQCYFYSQQAIQYPQNITKLCIQYLADSNPSTFSSLKKAHKYLCPVVKHYEKIMHQNQSSHLEVKKYEENENIEIQYLIENQEELRASARYILLVYYNFLLKVVPANISYFHFIRQKDFYTHYIALKYSLKFGFSHHKTLKFNLFNTLTSQTKAKIFDFFCHWLYDMVGYSCSIISLKSETLPYLIMNIYTLLCSLLADRKSPILQNFNSEQIYQIYHRVLWIMAYLLCKKNKERCYSSLQLIVGGINKLLNQMHGDGIRQQTKTPYTPSPWYAQQIGFVNQPYLQKIICLILIDLLKNREQIGPRIKLKHRKHRILFNKNKQGKYKKFEDERNLQTQNNLQIHDKMKQSSEQIQELEEGQMEGQDIITDYYQKDSFVKMQSMKQVTVLSIFQTLTSLLKIFPYLRQLPEIIDLLVSQIKKDTSQSIHKPYIVQICKIIHRKQSMVSSALNSERYNLNEDNDLQNKSIKQNKTNSINKKYKLRIPNKLNQYVIDNQDIRYSINKYVISCQVVGKNCSAFLQQNYIKMVQYFIQQQKQWDKNQGQLWGHLLKYNKHLFEELQN